MSSVIQALARNREKPHCSCWQTAARHALGQSFRKRSLRFVSKYIRIGVSAVLLAFIAWRTDWDVATYGIPIPQVDQMPAGDWALDLYLPIAE